MDKGHFVVVPINSFLHPQKLVLLLLVALLMLKLLVVLCFGVHFVNKKVKLVIGITKGSY